MCEPISQTPADAQSFPELALAVAHLRRSRGNTGTCPEESPMPTCMCGVWAAPPGRQHTQTKAAGRMTGRGLRLTSAPKPKERYDWRRKQTPNMHLKACCSGHTQHRDKGRRPAKSDTGLGNKPPRASENPTMCLQGVTAERSPREARGHWISRSPHHPAPHRPKSTCTEMRRRSCARANAGSGLYEQAERLSGEAVAGGE